MERNLLLENLNRSRVVDLTYSFHERMPYWPGKLQDSFRLTVEEVRSCVWAGCFSMPEHIGTHVDAPRHFVRDGRTIDMFTTDDFFAEAIVIDAAEKAEADADYCLGLDILERWEKENGKIPEGAVVFMHSGWGRRWCDFAAYLNQDSGGMLHFPGFSEEAASFLIHERAATALGLDTLSADNMIMTVQGDSPVHRIVHEAGKRIVENVARLDALPPRGAVVVVAPIPIEGGTGAPARLFSFLP